MGQQVFRYSDDAGLTQGACAALHHPKSQTKSIDSHNEWNGTVSKKHSPVPLVVQSKRFFLLGSGKGNHGQRGYPYEVFEAAVRQPKGRDPRVREGRPTRRPQLYAPAIHAHAGPL